MSSTDLQLQSEFITAFKNIEEFAKMLNSAPVQSECKERDGRKYLEIRIIEKHLDEMFAGLWQTENFRYQVIANELVGSIDLKIFHPVAKLWITRTGAGGCQIRMKSEKNGGDGDITNVRNKITNSLEADFPHLKANCLRNAAISLGAMFGRNLNIKSDSKFNPLLEPLTQKVERETQLNYAFELIDEFETEPSKAASFKNNLQKATNERIQSAIDFYEKKKYDEHK